MSDTGRAEKIAAMVALVGKEAWEQARLCESFQDATRVYEEYILTALCRATDRSMLNDGIVTALVRGPLTPEALAWCSEKRT